jgi:hypothetical protein
MRCNVKRLGIVIGLGMVAFAVTLAIYIGSHLSNEAMAVLIGAVCGVGAMLPATIIGALALLRRRDRADAVARASPPPQSMYPPVIVVAPPAMNPSQLANSTYMPVPPAAPPRQFTVIGDDPLDSSTD